MARVYDGRIVKLDVEEVRIPNGNLVTLEIIRHRGAAAVVPVDEEGRAVLIRQYRHATSGYLLEVPAGTLDPGEAPEACALREVEEETGLRAAHLTSLGWIWTTPGFTDEKIWLYLATGLTPTAQAHESDEVITVERLPLAEAARMAASGEITDGKSVCALLRASSRRG
jgi:ADP-ribose pyrophosphatase